jgi:hypothetical protein
MHPAMAGDGQAKIDRPLELQRSAMRSIEIASLRSH